MTDVLTDIDFLDFDLTDMEEGETEGKKRTHTAPILRRFIESGEPGREVPLSIWDASEIPDLNAARIKRDFENAKKAKEFDPELKADVFKIAGADAVDVKVRGGRVFLLNRPVILALKEAQAKEKK